MYRPNRPKPFHLSLSTLFSSLIVGVLLAVAASAQRDFFTPEEVELVREAQQIDQRIELLTKIVDRRFAALNVDVGGVKIKPKDAEKWGQMPTSTRLETLYDIRRILEKAIDDIDSLAERPDSMVIDEPEKGKKPKGYNELFPKAVRTLAAAAARYRPALKAELDRENGSAEKGSILAALEHCDEIIAAVAKLPAEVAKAKNKN